MSNSVKVVPEGVHVKTFNLEKDNNKISDYDDGRFKFIHFSFRPQDVEK